MAIPIPSGLPVNVNFEPRHNDLITPPSAPAVVENIDAIDPRVALNMPMPVGDSKAGGALLNVAQELASQDHLVNINAEPVAEQAVLLELSSPALGQDPAILDQTQSLLSQSLTKMDAQGGAALGQMLSEILQVNLADLGAQLPIANSGTAQEISSGEQVLDSTKVQLSSQEVVAQSAIVNWPSSAGQLSPNPADPRAAMTMLYQNLQNSGIFAADQLKKVLFPATQDDDSRALHSGDIQSQADQLVSQLATDSPTVRDSVKLLLRGDLLWQGQLMPNVQARLYREDAWESDPKQVGQLQKGSRLTLEVTLPNLGPVKVVGTQFGDSVHVSVIAGSESVEATLSNDFANLLEKMKDEVDPDARVSLKAQE